MYPKVWRDRYRREFEALLDDVSPRWSTLFDVFGGAVKMQVKIWSAWKIVAAFAVAGVVGSAAFTMTIPKRYVSTAVVRTGDTTEQELSRLESRERLVQLINQQDLYRAERARLPIEDIIEEMRRKDINIRELPGTGPKSFAVSFASTDAGQAQRTAERLAAQIVEVHMGTIVDPARLPVTANGPRLSRNIAMGLILGVVLGSLFAFFAGLRVWKLAAGLGLAGALAGAAVAYALPDRFVSTAVVRFTGSDQAAMRARVQRLVGAITSDESLRLVVQKLNLYSNEPDRERRMREHLHINFDGDGRAILIQFNDRNRNTAQVVTGHMVSLLLDQAIRDRAQGAALVRMTLELLDPPTLPINPYFPNRPVAAGTGVLVGFAAAMMLGFWRRYKGSVPAAAAL